MSDRLRVLRTGLTSVALLCLPLLAAAETVDARYLQSLATAQYRAYDSDALGRRLHVYVMLPDSYAESPEVEYPTVYVLDGGNLFPLLVPYYGYLNFQGEVPDAIIVGISYGADTLEGGNLRSTDYTAPSEERENWGGAGSFQTFLKTELLPDIEQRYRSQSDRRIVFGQSLRGQFVLFTALTEPDLFWGHIASNPALHRNLGFFLERHWDATAEPAPSRLFVASASNDAERFRGPALDWIRYWNDAENRPWLLKTTTLEGHSHMSAPPAAFRAGMRWLFEDSP